MTVTTTARKAGPYIGNSVTTAFPFAFKVFANTDVVVTQAIAGVESTLALGTDYTVALNGDQDGSPGGNVNMLIAPDATKTLVISSAVPQTQSTVVTNNGGFFAAVFNTVFDRLTILVQQLSEKLGRSFTVPITSAVTNFIFPVTPSGLLQWSADGTQLVAIPLGSAALVPALPNMAGKIGQFLTNDGAATASWTNVLGAFSPIGGATAAFPALKRSGAQVQVRLGDDSAFADLVLSKLFFGTPGVGVPMLKANGAALEARLGDDSGLTTLNTAGVNLNGQTAASQNFAIAMAIAFGA